MFFCQNKKWQKFYIVKLNFLYFLRITVVYKDQVKCHADFKMIFEFGAKNLYEEEKNGGKFKNIFLFLLIDAHKKHKVQDEFHASSCRVLYQK